MLGVEILEELLLEEVLLELLLLKLLIILLLFDEEADEARLPNAIYIQVDIGHLR